MGGKVLSNAKSRTLILSFASAGALICSSFGGGEAMISVLLRRTGPFLLMLFAFTVGLVFELDATGCDDILSNFTTGK
jgi:hypothetical protein